MKYVFFLTPVFQEWAIEIIRTIKAHDRDASFVALTTSRRVDRAVREKWSGIFADIVNMEQLELAWIAESRPAEIIEQRLRHYDQILGSGVIQRFIIADRHIGSGYITGADALQSRMIRTMRDRNTLLRYHAGLLDFIDQFLSAHKPDRMFFHCVAGGYPLAFGEMCRVRNIVFRHFQHSRLQDRFVIDSSPKGLCPEIAGAFLASRENPEILDEFRDDARRILQELRDKKEQPEYVAHNKKMQAAAYKLPGLVKATGRALAKLFLYRFVQGRPPLRGYDHFTEFMQTLIKPVRFYATRGARFYCDRKALKKGGYIYFPLHVDPEATTMVTAPDHTNQLAVIEALSKKTPLTMPIVVKDHAPMVGLRPLWFYRRLARIPNVLVVNPYDSSLDLMRDSAAVATITGTVAWEALVFGRPALVMGDSPFRDIGQGLVYHRDVTGLDQAIVKTLSLPPVPDAALIDWIAATLKESFSCPTKLLWGYPSGEEVLKHKAINERVAADIMSDRKISWARAA